MTLWCKILGKLVEVTLVTGRTGRSAVPGVPDGWRVAECLDKDVECFGKGCPFTTDGMDSPFGEAGQFPDAPLESFDPSTDPLFEGEWD